MEDYHAKSRILNTLWHQPEYFRPNCLCQDSLQDLNMSVGKVAAQVGHAVHHAVTHSRPEMIEDDLDKIQNLRRVMRTTSWWFAVTLEWMYKTAIFHVNMWRKKLTCPVRWRDLKEWERHGSKKVTLKVDSGWPQGEEKWGDFTGRVDSTSVKLRWIRIINIHDVYIYI